MSSNVFGSSPMDYVKAPVKLVKKPIGFVKGLFSSKKEKKTKVAEVLTNEPGNEDQKRKHFENGYALFSEENYYDAAIELYRFLSASSPDEDDYEWAQFFFGISLNRLNYSHAAIDVLETSL